MTHNNWISFLIALFIALPLVFRWAVSLAEYFAVMKIFETKESTEASTKLGLRYSPLITIIPLAAVLLGLRFLLDHCQVSTPSGRQYIILIVGILILISPLVRDFFGRPKGKKWVNLKKGAPLDVQIVAQKAKADMWTTLGAVIAVFTISVINGQLSPLGSSAGMFGGLIVGIFLGDRVASPLAELYEEKYRKQERQQAKSACGSALSALRRWACPGG